MAIQPFASSDCFAMLEAHHLKRMRPEMKRALLLLAGGMPTITRRAVPIAHSI